MAVHWLRRPYRTKCRFFHDSNRESEIIWYQAPANAQWIGIDSVYQPLNWQDKEEPQEHLGEVKGAKRSYYDGKNRWGYRGQCFVGDAASYVDGLSISDVAILPLPDCCSHGKLSSIRFNPGASSEVTFGFRSDVCACVDSFYVSNFAGAKIHSTVCLCSEVDDDFTAYARYASTVCCCVEAPAHDRALAKYRSTICLCMTAHVNSTFTPSHIRHSCICVDMAMTTTIGLNARLSFPCMCVTASSTILIPTPTRTSCICVAFDASSTTTTGGGQTFDCDQCPDGSPLVWEVVLSGFTDGLAEFNGTWTLHYVSGCLWAAFSGDANLNFSFGADPVTILALFDVETGWQANYSVGAVDCTHAVVLDQQFVIGGDGPLTVTVTPA